MIDEIQKYFQESLTAIRLSEEHLSRRLCQAVDVICQCLRDGGGLLVFGNGGSASDAQHMVTELVGRFMQERRPLKAIALTGNSALQTALANDYGYEHVFSRQIEALGSPRDIAIGLSTSGNSPNVIAALQKARDMGMKTIVLTGSGGGLCAPLADILLDVPAKTSPRIQEAHAVIYHIICQMVEKLVACPKP